MASGKAYLHFILEQLSDLDDVSYRPMMGEFILYYRGKIVGGIYDDRLLVKKTRSALELMPAAICELPYEGAKEMLLVDEVDSKALTRPSSATAGTTRTRVSSWNPAVSAAISSCARSGGFRNERSDFCPSGDLSTPKIRLSSDSASRRTPLPLAKSSRYRASSGLSPYRTCAHRAHSEGACRLRGTDGKPLFGSLDSLYYGTAESIGCGAQRVFCPSLSV